MKKHNPDWFDQYEIYWSNRNIGQEPRERVVAICEDIKAAFRIREALAIVYISPLCIRRSADKVVIG